MITTDDGVDSQLETHSRVHRLTALVRAAPLEFARVAFGLADLEQKRRRSSAADDVAWAQADGAPITLERAEQRARAYLPVAGQEHCPRCWVLAGRRSLLHFRRVMPTHGELADCATCNAQYQT
ncbi:MAG: hypothetical protein ABIW85_03920 [Variovorax sp.]